MSSTFPDLEKPADKLYALISAIYTALDAATPKGVIVAEPEDLKLRVRDAIQSIKQS